MYVILHILLQLHSLTVILVLMLTKPNPRVEERKRFQSSNLGSRGISKGNHFISFIEFAIIDIKRINAKNRKRKSHQNISKGLERINKFSTHST